MRSAHRLSGRTIVPDGLIEPDIDYERLQALFQDHLEPDVQLFNEYHALLVRVGKEFCKPKPRCAGCPLEGLPHHVECEQD